jgi:hypothetical protein
MNAAMARGVICRGALTLLLSAAAALTASASVAVIANRTSAPLIVHVDVGARPIAPLKLAPGDSRPIVANDSVQVRIGAATASPTPLQAGHAYAIDAGVGISGAALSQIDLGPAPPRPWKTDDLWLAPPAGRVVNVKILVDDDERRPRSAWEPALRARVAAASQTLVAHGGPEFRVTAVDTWISDNGERDFLRTLKQFEQAVPAAPADIAIGFSSQYEFAVGRIHLGGTRGAFHSHILLKERAGKVLDPERIELLTHELGHWLGATHSADATSVMRPVVGQGQLRVTGATLRFDPPNALLLALMGEEIRLRGVTKLDDVSPDTRRRMASIYEAVLPTVADDPATAHYLQLLGAAAVRPLLKDAQRMVEQVDRAAQVHQKKPLVPVDTLNATDRLLERYVRQAALVAGQSHSDSAPQALLLALGVAFDDCDALSGFPTARDVIQEMEPSAARQRRFAVMGGPTMHGSTSLARSFFGAAHLVALSGSQSAREAQAITTLAGAGVGEPIQFADAAAARAGVVFAHAVLMRRLSLDAVAQHFTTEAVFPSPDALRAECDAPETLSRDEAAFADVLLRLEARLTSLPAYNNHTP